MTEMINHPPAGNDDRSPRNVGYFEFEELGALLLSLGKVMINNCVSLTEARSGHYNEQLVTFMLAEGVGLQKATELLSITLEEVGSR